MGVHSAGKIVSKAKAESKRPIGSAGFQALDKQSERFYRKESASEKKPASWGRPAPAETFGCVFVGGSINDLSQKMIWLKASRKSSELRGNF